MDGTHSSGKVFALNCKLKLVFSPIDLFYAKVEYAVCDLVEMPLSINPTRKPRE